MTTTSKLLTLFIALMVITAAGVGWQSYKTSKEDLINVTTSKLQAIRVTKKQQIDHYFNQLKNQCLTLSESTMIVDAMKAFKSGFGLVPQELKLSEEQLNKTQESLKAFYQNEFLKRLNAFVETPRRFIDYAPSSSSGILLQNLYIAQNPNPFGSKSNLDSTGDSTTYTKTHAYYHPILREFMKRFKYADISLVDHETGDIVYLYSKEIDFANNLTQNLLKETNFARLYEQLLTVSTKNTAIITDFASYDPSFAAPAAFIGAPIFEGDKKIGLIIIQLSLEAINDIMTNNGHWEEIGLGKTGENLLVGRDRYMRSTSRFFLENPLGYQEELELLKVPSKVIDKIRAYNTTVLQQQLSLPVVQEIFKNKAGVTLGNDYRNKPVIASYEPLNFAGLEWGIVTKVDQAEVAIPLKQLLKNLIVTSLVLIGLSSLLMWLALRSLLFPIRRIADYCSHIVHGWRAQNLQALLLPLEPTEDMGYLAAQINQLVYMHEKQLSEIETKKKNLESFIAGLDVAARPAELPETLARDDQASATALYYTRDLLNYILERYTRITDYIHDMHELIIEHQQQLVALDKLLYQHKTAIMGSTQAHQTNEQFYIIGERLGEMQALVRRLENSAQEQHLVEKKLEQILKDIAHFEVQQKQIIQNMGLDTEPHALVEQIRDYIKLLKKHNELEEQKSDIYKKYINELKEKIAALALDK